MGIKSIKMQSMGQAGVLPQIIYIETDDTYAAVTTAGYLNNAQTNMNFQFTEGQMALVATKVTPGAAAVQVVWLEVGKTGDNWSLGGESHMTKYAGKAADGGGSATIAITVTGVLATDTVFAQVEASTNAAAVNKVTPTANTITVILSGDPGASSIISYQVLRAAV